MWLSDLMFIADVHHSVIENPYNAESGKFELGTRKIVRGPKSFFLQPPHEKLVNTSRVHVLGIDDALHPPSPIKGDATKTKECAHTHTHTHTNGA